MRIRQCRRCRQRPGDVRDGTCIRVTYAIAGSGKFHLSRIGDEVLIDFEYGDKDDPIIVSVL